MPLLGAQRLATVQCSDTQAPCGQELAVNEPHEQRSELDCGVSAPNAEAINEDGPPAKLSESLELPPISGKEKKKAKKKAKRQAEEATRSMSQGCTSLDSVRGDDEWSLCSYEDREPEIACMG